MSVNRSAPSDVSKIAVLGASLKMEVVELQPDAGDTIDDNDRFFSRMQHPQFGFVFPATAVGATFSFSITIDPDGDNDKEIEINLDDGTIAANARLVAVIFGR